MTETGRFSEVFAENQAVDAALSGALHNYEPPAFPAVVLSALRQLREDAPLSQVGRTLASDPRMTIKLLSICNSPAFGFRSPVLSIEHAASLLGRNQLEALVLSMGVRSAMPARPAPAIQMRRFWYGAARRAALARSLAMELEPGTAGLSYTAALLQDMALPVLAERSGPEYGQLLSQWRDDHGDLSTLEQDKYGFSHADVGGWMCERWAFPEELTAAIGGHHSPRRRYSSRPPESVRLVAGLREEYENFGAEAFVDGARVATGLPSDNLMGLIETASQNAGEVANLYS